jgi:hypothetical protein
MMYRANFTNHVRDIHETTGWHPTSEAAQAALMRLQNVGPFQLLAGTGSIPPATAPKPDHRIRKPRTDRVYDPGVDDLPY